MSLSSPEKAEASHAATMDMVYRYQRHIYDVTRKYYLLGRDETIAGLDLKPGMRLLEIGCGTGRNLCLSARHFPKAQFFGLDISSEMLAQAKHNLRRQNTKASLVAADAARFDAKAAFGENGFERVLMSYTLSMIPPWQDAIRQALAALLPNGQLHIVDFGQQENLPRFAKPLLHAWLKKFHVQPRSDLKQVLQTLALEYDCEMTFKPLYRGYAWQAVLTKTDKGKA